MNTQEITLLKQEAEQLAAQTSPDHQAVLKLVSKLKEADLLHEARLLLDKVRKLSSSTWAGLALEKIPRDQIRLGQEHALCTYKDEYLSVDKRYAAALDILDGIGLRQPECHDKETLGQGGAIYKRLWESTGQTEYLHISRAYYKAGWERDRDNDRGWCGVNATYLLDLLAYRERISAARTGAVQTNANAWMEEANGLRRQIKGFFQDRRPEGYWDLATLAEVCLGLSEYEEAAEWLGRAHEALIKPGESDGAATELAEKRNWMLQTTVRQLVNLLRVQGVYPVQRGSDHDENRRLAQRWEQAKQALNKLIGEFGDAPYETWRGKVGIALSGGGFRAALFHLGVLARLAECNVLRHVETLSTVSGGSIVGAHYYLELRKLLQSKPDDEIKPEDYMILIRDLINSSMAGIEKNLRVRALANLWANLKMIFLGSYSRSMRMAELYEAHLFNQVQDDHKGGFMRRMKDLLIHPTIWTGDKNGITRSTHFRPSTNNWLRCAKVPNLMLNTTALNTGHNWHFTARWMGEPPGLIGDEIDMNERYRRLKYEEAPNKRLSDYPLSYAVAASSCVPALFEPLPLQELYPNRTLRLVDGGVHDNQGMEALINDGCDFILCSDASGQLESEPDPANGMLGVFWRSDSILQDRVREAQYKDVKNRVDAGALRGLFFVHLKQELESDSVSWINGPAAPTQPQSNTASYNVDRELQRYLSEIRTDLDSFTEVESYALMCSGYLMTDRQLRDLDAAHKRSGLPGTWGGFDIEAPMHHEKGGGQFWPFEPLIPLMALPADSSDLRRKELGRQLKMGSVMFGRVWRLVGWLKTLGFGIAAAALVAGIVYLNNHWDENLDWTPHLSVSQVTWGVVLLLLGFFSPLVKFFNPKKATQTGVVNAIVALVGFCASNVHLHVFEPILKCHGRLARLLRG